MIDRRGFLASLTGLLGTAVLDPERLLWRPGEKMISIPAAKLVMPQEFQISELNIGDILTFAGRFEINPISRKSTGRLQRFVITNVGLERVGLTPCR